MKRLTVGVELVAQPRIIFMDEPTSGMDAFSAKLIMNGVRKIANSGRAIVWYHHSPTQLGGVQFLRLTSSTHVIDIRPLFLT
ncbi:hypothetical protein PR003_g21395 [Phytophthora rubi]|uniref:ABC transporter family G domain-containing protein n=1 Tax=Phytophthora rubi TaxID=129364 RepID=A0A6A4DGE7_9STRA|nr:hypothetical protein PR003_g21395 [Phytophthora rubi]